MYYISFRILKYIIISLVYQPYSLLYIVNTMTLNRRPRNKDNSGSLFSIVISFGLLVFSGYVIFDSLGNISEVYEKVSIVSRQQQNVESIRLEHLTEKQELEYVLSEEYIEDMARDKFGYAKSGETVFVFSDDLEGQVAGVQTETPKIAVSKPIDDWKELLLN